VFLIDFVRFSQVVNSANVTIVELMVTKGNVSNTGQKTESYRGSLLARGWVGIYVRRC